MEIINYLKRNNGSGHIVEHVGWHESGDYLLRLLFSESDKPFRQHKYEVEKEYNVIDMAEVEALERMTCPRRNEAFAFGYGEENQDYWQTLPNGDRTCSYCGSAHPEDVIKLLEDFGPSVLSPSTKSYKWYIHRPNVKNALEGTIKFYTPHFSKEQIDRANTLMKK